MSTPDINALDIHAGVRTQQRMVFGYDTDTDTYNIVQVDEAGILSTKQMVWDPNSSSWVPATQPPAGLTNAELRASPVDVAAASLPLPNGASTDTTSQQIRDRLPEDGVQESLSKLNWIMRVITSVFGRFSFDPTSQLRTAVSGTVAISSGTVTTVTTMTTGNIGLGDIGKNATAVLMSFDNPNVRLLTRV